MEDDDGEHEVDLGAVGAAAAGEGSDGADNDGSGTYQVYHPKLVKARDAHLRSSRLRRCACTAASPMSVAMLFVWRESPVVVSLLTRALLVAAGGHAAPGPRGGDAHAGCGAWRAVSTQALLR